MTNAPQTATIPHKESDIVSIYSLGVASTTSSGAKVVIARISLCPGDEGVMPRGVRPSPSL